ncbi:MAG: MBL fold metallo-hydrolase [Xanthomonadales bacterium]|nr:MBL fold metallo-hydrolase [Xanthomonadales bacterium]
MRFLRLAALLCACLISPPALAGDATYLLVLGIAQDAGYPQAGCYRPHCQPGWDDPDRRRLASSVAVIDEAGGATYLIDATPDIRHQLYRLNRAAPGDAFALRGVFPTHGHIGHYTGLMHFGFEAMNAEAVPVYALPRMKEFLSSNGPWDQLVRYRNIELRPLEADSAVQLAPRLSVTPFEVPHRDEYTETAGFRIDGPERSAVYIPDIDKWDRWTIDIREVVGSVDYALIDATFFADGEIPGRDMADIPHPFVEESMALLADLSPEERGRVYFIHMNHTNPLLQDGSEAERIVRGKGFRVAREGLRLDL